MSERLCDRIWRGSLSLLAHRVVIYGANAMHWAVNVRVFGNWVCFHPTTRTFGGRWPWYFYISPDATSFRATFGFGPGYDP